MSPCPYRGCQLEFSLSADDVERAFELAEAHDIDIPVGRARGVPPFCWDARSLAINCWLDFTSDEDPIVTFYFERRGGTSRVHVVGTYHPGGGMGRQLSEAPLDADRIESGVRMFRQDLLNQKGP